MNVMYQNTPYEKITDLNLLFVAGSGSNFSLKYRFLGTVEFGFQVGFVLRSAAGRMVYIAGRR